MGALEESGSAGGGAEFELPPLLSGWVWGKQVERLSFYAAGREGVERGSGGVHRGGGRELQEKGTLWKGLEAEVFAEIGAAGFGVVDEGFGGAREEDFAFLDKVGAVDDGEDFAGVVIGDENADLFLLEEADEVLDVGDGEGVDVGKGFVEEEERGLGDEGAGDFEAAALAAREGGGFLGAEVFEVEFLEEGVEAFFAVGTGDGFEDAEDVVFDGKGAEDGGLLGEIAKAELGPFMDGEMGDVLPLKIDFAAFGLDEADGHVKGGGFAGAVGAEEADDFSRIEVEGEAVDDRFSVVAFDEVFNFEKSHR